MKTANGRSLGLCTWVAVLILAGTSACRADIVSVGGAVVEANPPASILHGPGAWQNNTEIRAWTERTLVLPIDLNLGHVASGFYDGSTPLVNGPVPAGTAVTVVMVHADPVGNTTIDLTGFVTFDTPIIGVYIGSQLVLTDDLLGRPGVAYNENPYRGLELDGPGGSPDFFDISADRFRIDFRMVLGSWTDDIRIVTDATIPAIVPGGACVLTDPPPSIGPGQWESDSEIRCWFERSFVLTAPLPLEHVDTGFVDTIGGLVGGDLPAGTRICSHLARADAVGAGTASLSGSLLFDGPILGVLIGSQLITTDVLLGRPGVSYGTGLGRGLELDGPAGSLDSFAISAGRRLIDFTMDGDSDTDEMRILVAAPTLFIRGDVNRDRNVDLVDAVVALNHIFNAGPASCRDAIDVDDDGSIGLIDMIDLLGYLFLAGAPPLPPFPEPGNDPTPDALGCDF